MFALSMAHAPSMSSTGSGKSNGGGGDKAGFPVEKGKGVKRGTRRCAFCVDWGQTCKKTDTSQTKCDLCIIRNNPLCVVDAKYEHMKSKDREALAARWAPAPRPAGFPIPQVQFPVPAPAPAPAPQPNVAARPTFLNGFTITSSINPNITSEQLLRLAIETPEDQANSIMAELQAQLDILRQGQDLAKNGESYTCYDPEDPMAED